MRIKYLFFRNLIFFIVCSLLYTEQSFGQSISVTTNGPQTITVNSASLTSTASSNNTINTTQWTKFSAPGQTLKKVTVVGSSTAAGVGAPAGNAFVDRLRTYYQTEGVISDIINLSAGGGVPFGWDINYVLNTTTPDVLLVCFPTNGYTASNNANVINRYLEIQAACNSRGIQMVVTGTQPRNDFNDADRANLITLNNLFRSTFPTQFVDFLTPLLNTNGNVIKAEYYGDGVHPNEAGHAVLFQQVRAFNMFKNTISSSSIINSPASAATNITNLTPGVHRFQVGVLDNGGFAASAVATITVNGNGGPAGPTANAGTAQSITLPTTQTTLSGSGTAGNGGSLTYAWTQVGGTAASIASQSSASTNITGLTTEGIRTFRLTVTQSDNQTATSDVTVTVNPASGGGGGNGKTIPGKVEAEAWDAKSGGMYAVATNDAGGGQHVVGIANGGSLDYNVNVTTSGVYTVNFRVATTQANTQFQLKLGTTVLGTVTIPGTGGWDTWATVPLTNITLTAGAQTLRILSITNATCNFNWMDFVLTSAPTPPPTANAGPAQSITLPVSQAALSGSGTVSNGGPIVYGWTQVGGTAATIASPSSASTNITGLTTTGARTFRLTVTQSDNQTATSDVTVTVLPPAGCSAPVVTAPTVTQPTCATLTGTIIVNATGAGTLEYSLDFGLTWQSSATFSNLAPANYALKVRLQGTNCETAYSGNPVSLVQSPFCNIKGIPGKIEAESWDTKSGGMYAVPTSDAGGGQHVVGISNGSWMDYNATVNQTGIYTANFRVATTQANTKFQLKLGANIIGTVTIPNTGGWDTWLTVPLTNISLTAGSQTLRVQSITNETCNLNWLDFVLIAGGNPPPTANAGSAQSITLPVSQATLSGSGTVSNSGPIVYGWTQVGGTAATIASPSSASSNITGLTTAGVRTFRLTVTQSDNQTATSDVTVTVNPASGGGGNGKTIPGKIEAENFDAKSGGMYGVATNDAGGGQHVVGISNGSWMDYNVTVNQTGTYTVNFRVATTQLHAQFQVKLGATVLGTINIPGTGGWDIWQTVALNNISLTAGVQTIRIQLSSNESCNFNWTDWVLSAPLTAMITPVNRSVDDAPIVSKIKPTELSASDMSVSIFPNPAASYFNLKVQSRNMEAVTIRITDIAGRPVQELKAIAGQTIRFGDKMMKGTYLIEVRQGTERAVTTMIRQ